MHIFGYIDSYNVKRMQFIVYWGTKDRLDAMDPELEGANWVVRHAECFLEAGADVVMIDSDGITENVNNWRTDVIAKVIEWLGLEKIIFEAAAPRVFGWFIQNYGSKASVLLHLSYC